MSNNPTIVLIGGAFQTTEFYEPLKSALETLDYEVILPTLPTCSDIDRIELGRKHPADDVAVVQKEVEALVDQSKSVVVMMHSYGGLVGNSLKIQDLTTAARKAKGLRGGVELFLWYASAALPENVSFRMSNGGKIPDFDQCMPDGTYNFLIAEESLLGELAPADRAKWLPKILPQTQNVFDYTISDAAWKYVPSIVLLTENDTAFPAALQEMHAQVVGAKKVVRLNMDHGAHLAHTNVLANTISDALRSVDA